MTVKLILFTNMNKFLLTNMNNFLSNLEFLFKTYDSDNLGYWTKETFFKFLIELGKQESKQDQFEDVYYI